MIVCGNDEKRRILIVWRREEKDVHCVGREGKDVDCV